MADDVQVKIGAQVGDAISGMAKVGASVDDITGAMRSLQGPLNAIAERFTALSQKELALAESANVAAAAQQRLNSTFTGQIANSMRGAATGAQEMGGALTELAPIIAGFAIVELGKHFVETAMEMQNLHFQMIASTGSTQDAAQAMDFARKLSDQYGLSLKETAQGLSDFTMNAIRGGLTLKQTETAFEGLTVGMKALHLTTAQSERSFYALQEMMSLGTVQTRQLRMLNMDMKVSFETMAEAVGVSASKFKEMVENGEVVASDFLPKLGAALKKNFGDVAKEASDNLQANLGRASTAWTDLQTRFGDSGGLSAANAGVKMFTEVIKNSNPVMDAAAYAVKLLETAFLDLGYAENSVVAVAERAAARFKAIFEAIVSYAEALKTGVTRGFNAMENEMSATTSRMEHGLVVANTDFKKRADEIQATFDKMNSSIWDKKVEKPIKLPITGGVGGDAEGKEKKSRVPEWEADLQQMLMAEQKFGQDAEAEELSYWEKKLNIAKKGTAEYSSIVGKIYSLESQMRTQGIQDEIANYDLREQAAQGNWAQEQKIANEKLVYLAMTYGNQNKIYKAALDARFKMEDKHDKDVAAEQKKLTDKYAQGFMNVARTFNTSIKNMINGSQTFGQSMVSLLGSLIGSFVEFCEQQVAHWAATEIAKYVMSARTSAQQSATLATAGAADVTTKGGFSRLNIAGDAAAAYAGVFANLAPVLGPFAAAPATAAYADVMSMQAAVPSFAVGAWQLPGDTMANVHKGEMIVPAGPAAGFRDFLKGMGQNGGGDAERGGGITNIHIHATDAQSVKRLLKANGGAVASAIANQARNGNRSIRGRSN